jgi:hypothetical protein
LPKRELCVAIATFTSGIFTITGAMEFLFIDLNMIKRQIRAYVKAEFRQKSSLQ